MNKALTVGLTVIAGIIAAGAGGWLAWSDGRYPPSSPITIADGSITFYSDAKTVNIPFAPTDGGTVNDGKPHSQYNYTDPKRKVPFIEVLGCPSNPAPGVSILGCNNTPPPIVSKNFWKLMLADGSYLSLNKGAQHTVAISLKTPQPETQSNGTYSIKLPIGPFDPATLTYGTNQTYTFSCPAANQGKNCIMFIQFV